MKAVITYTNFSGTKSVLYFDSIRIAKPIAMSLAKEHNSRGHFTNVHVFGLDKSGTPILDTHHMVTNLSFCEPYWEF